MIMSSRNGLRALGSPSTVGQADEGVAEGVGVPNALNRQTVTTGQLIAKLQRFLGAGDALDLNGEPEVIVAGGQAEGLEDAHILSRHVGRENDLMLGGIGP